MIQEKKIVYVVSQVNKSLAFEWTAHALSKSSDFTMVVLNPTGSALEEFLKANSIKVVYIKYTSKFDLPLAFLRLAWMFLRQQPDVVHAHLFDATLVGLSAAWIMGVKRRVYTRHTSTYHHDYFPSSVKYDKYCNGLATHIISISQATEHTLVKLEAVDPAKVVKIPHGFRFDRFQTDETRIKTVASRWNIPGEGPRIGVIARHIEWKGVQYTVEAFRNFVSEYPSSCLVLANARGPYHEAVLGLLKGIPSQNFRLIPFEEDIASLYQLFDIFVHVPIDPYCEAFGQTYIEALANGVPSVFTLSGIAAEFVKDADHALVVDFRNTDAIELAMKQIWTDMSLQQRLRENGKAYVTAHFGFETMLDALNKVYDG